MYPIVGISQESALDNFAQLIIRNYCSSHKFTKNPWITEYPGEVFVVFDPMTDESWYPCFGAYRGYYTRNILCRRCSVSCPFVGNGYNSMVGMELSRYLRRNYQQSQGSSLLWSGQHETGELV